MNSKTVVVYGGSLSHYGIPGMKWGVWNEETRARYTGNRVKKERKHLSNDQKKKIKKVASTVAKLTVATAVAVYVAKNPKARKVVGKAIKKVGEATARTLKESANNFKEGVKEGFREGPKKLGKAVVIGGFMVTGKLWLDSVLGKDVSNAIFKANDKKSIGKFWNGLPVAQDEDSDD